MTALTTDRGRLSAPPRGGSPVAYLARTYVGWMLATVALTVVVIVAVELVLVLTGEPILREDLALMAGSILGWSQAILLGTAYGLRTPAVLAAGARRRDHLAALGVVSAPVLVLDALLIAAVLVVAGLAPTASDIGVAVLLVAAFHVAGVLVSAAYLHLGGLLGTLALPLTLPVVPVYLLSVDMGPRPGFAVCLALSLAWLVAASIAAVLLGRSAPAPRRLL